MRKYKFYKNTESAWYGMLSAIKQARSSIYLESYIFEDNTGADFDFTQAFLDKVASGVRVRIVLDGFGSMFFSADNIDKLRQAGAEVLFFNHWFRRIHRKILIVDNEIAFLGGVSIGKKYRRWLDLNIRLSDRRVVRPLVRSFGRSYFYCGGTDQEVLNFKKGKKIRRTGSWLLEHFPWTGGRMLKRYYEEKIDQAKKKVILVTPYLAPHRWLIKSLQLARARGVSIEIIIPESSDFWLSTLANQIFATSLSNLGINFYLSKEMIHAKTILVDDKIGLVGSNNLDGLSFDLNVEAGVSFEKKEMIEDLKNIIEAWKKDAVLFEPSEQDKRWYYKIIESIATFIQPVL